LVVFFLYPNPILIVVLLVEALEARETWLYRRTPKVQVEEGQWYTEGMLNSIDERDERVIEPKTRPRESCNTGTVRVHASFTKPFK
jgi:hypothetical protein